MAYERKPEGVRFNPKYRRIMEHRGYATSIFWNRMMLDFLRRRFATTLNQELADWLGVSVRTMLRKARELGLEKDAAWLKKVYRDRVKMAFMVNQAKGYPGRIKKGDHIGLEYEYKPGRVAPPEERKLAAEKSKTFWRRNPRAAHLRAVKAWETRRKKMKQASFEYQVNAAGQERWIQHNDIHVHSCHECPHWQDSDEGPRCEYPDYPPCND